MATKRTYYTPAPSDATIRELSDEIAALRGRISNTPTKHVEKHVTDAKLSDWTLVSKASAKRDNNGHKVPHTTLIKHSLTDSTVSAKQAPLSNRNQRLEWHANPVTSGIYDNRGKTVQSVVYEGKFTAGMDTLPENKPEVKKIKTVCTRKF